MKAISYATFGPPEVLECGERPEPSRGRGQVRVRVRAAALNPKDVLLRKGKMRWLPAGSLPRVPGYDFAGVLEDDAPDMKAGTEVFGMIQSNAGGACAELAVVPVGELAPKPEGLSMAEAASLPLAGQTALQALRDELGVAAGQRVLLNGASGGVGTLAVQIAKALGAEVIAVCSERNAELVRGLGADRVIDYTSEDPATERELDHVFDIYGNLPWPLARKNHHSPAQARQCTASAGRSPSAAPHSTSSTVAGDSGPSTRHLPHPDDLSLDSGDFSGLAKTMLRPGGRYCTTVPQPGAIVRGALRRVGLHRAALVVVRSRRADLEQLSRWVLSGALRPVVDRTLPWTAAVAAHEYLETRRARGKVVLTFDD